MLVQEWQLELDLLFNGKDLKGWHGYNEQGAPDCWRVKEGALEILTEGRRECTGNHYGQKIQKFCTEHRIQTNIGPQQRYYISGRRK